MPSNKRREENYKFLFKRFFKHIQTKSEDSELQTQSAFEYFMALVFSTSEILEYFKVVKEIRHGQDGRRSGRISYYLPKKLNTEFTNRIIKNELLREELAQYLNCVLRDQIREEITKKTRALTVRFRDLFNQDDDPLFFSAVEKKLNGKLLRFWTLNEVDQIIVDLNEKINNCMKDNCPRFV